MKVEFKQSEILGATLVIEEAEFSKAKSKESEFDSLLHATDAFANLFDADCYICEDEYNAVLDYLEKNGIVIFKISDFEYQNNLCVEILVSNNNEVKKVVYVDETGYHRKRKARVSQKSIESTKKRRESGF